MTVRITTMTDEETARDGADDESGLGALQTERGSLPLNRIDMRADITGLTSQVELTQDFLNTFDVPLEASYVFPLPARSAVTRMRITTGDRIVEAELQEREAARRAYGEAIESGQRASIAEEERPDVFTMRVGNLLPGERVSVAITLVNPLVYEDGEATFRFPLVVAPRYIPGSALMDAGVGDGYANDTEAVPDASRITPPRLFPDAKCRIPVTIDVGIDAAGLALPEVRSSLPAVHTKDGRIRVQPGERADRDFVLRLRYDNDLTDSLILVPDAKGEEGTYQLTVLPPALTALPLVRDVVLVLDCSSSMAGWKIAAAQRVASRIVDSLTSSDRFAVLTFDDRVDRPDGLPDGLVEANDRNRYRAVEHLARVEAGGGTELFSPLRRALDILHEEGDLEARSATVVLVTDGQIGNEDQLLRELSIDLRRVRVHAVGIDQAANAGFLGRLAGIGGGRCELVESEGRLDEALQAIYRRIGAPLAHSLSLRADGLQTIDDTASPTRLPDLFPGVPLVVTGRYRGSATGSVVLSGTTCAGEEWSTTVAGQRRDAAAVTAQWARAHVRDLEDRYASTYSEELAKRIVDTSLRFGVLSRFTAYVAVGNRAVAEGELRHRVVQPVEVPAGWDEYLAQDDAVEGRAHVTKTARTVKPRNVIALALAAVLLVGCGWIWSLGRDGFSTSPPDGVVAGKRPEPADASLPQTKGGISESPPLTTGITDEITKAPLPQAPPTTVARDIITTGSLQLVVAQPAEVADRLVSAATDAGGRVDSRSERSGSSSPIVDLVLRIPADKLDGVLADAKKLGTVRSMSIGHTDVTAQRVDLDARIEALQTSVNRLLQLMVRAATTSDLLAAESSLTQRQAELDSLRAQRTTLGDQVTYATINVNVSAEPAVTPRTGFLGALQHGWHSVLSTANGTLLTVGFLIPWLPVLTILVLALVVVLRRKGKVTRASCRRSE